MAYETEHYFQQSVLVYIFMYVYIHTYIATSYRILWSPKFGLVILHIYFSSHYLFFLVLDFFFFFVDRVSPSSSGYSGTHSVDQTGLKVKDLPASVCQVQLLKACTTIAQHLFII